MKTFFGILLILALVALVFGLIFGVSWFAYWLVLSAGAPKYVAVIVGIAVFFIGCKVNYSK